MAKNSVNDDENLRRIEIERKEINAAYDNGHSNDSNESDSDKNGSSSKSDTLINDNLQERTDRYGFIHNKKLPPELTEIELKRNNIEKLREKKWLSMLKDWKSFNTKYNEKLVSRVFKGIPNSMRNPAWFKFLDIEAQMKAQAGVYEKMKNLAREYSLDLRQIDLDINRTFRNNLAYRKRYCQRQVQLYNILAAYSIYNTEIGYCQGMSSVTALLLMYLADEEKTFWALSQLMSNSKYSMHGFFKRDFPKLIRYADKHDMIIKTFLPKVHKKFIKCNITSLLYTTKWFLQCYLDALPFSLVLRVWDAYLLKGDIVMLAMSYCILRIHKRRLLLKEYDMDKINEFLNHKLPDDFVFSDDEVMEKLQLCIDKLARFKFSNGALLEQLPHNELPKIPFGEFKKFDKQEILSQMVQKSNEKASKNDRDAAVEQLAKDRLEVEKKAREEKRKKKLETNDANNGPILNISDEEEDYDNDDLDDSDDDLNPSKLSEYDDDKIDKESMLSNLTRQSTPQRSFTDIHSQLSLELINNINNAAAQKSSQPSTNNSTDSLRKNLLNIKQSQSNISFMHQNSEYENLSTSLSNKSSINRQSTYENFNNNNNNNDLNDNRKTPTQSPKLAKPILVTATNTTNNNNNNNNSLLSPKYSPNKNNPNYNSSTIPLSHSYVTTIKSNPPPISPSSFISHSNHVTSITTNPIYYTNNTTSPKIITNGNYEYVRSPHGIYTRVNVPPFNNNNDLYNRSKLNTIYTPIPQSTSTYIMNTRTSSANLSPVVGKYTTSPSSSLANNKRTSSLRSSGHKNQQQQLQQVNTSLMNSSSKLNYVRVNNAPTKQQLESHSIKIASIQQQQQLNGAVSVANHYPTISIISQAPKQQQQQTPTTPNFNHQAQHANTTPVFHRNSSATRSSSTNRNNNKINSSNNEEIIEQYDYI